MAAPSDKKDREQPNSISTNLLASSRRRELFLSLKEVSQQDPD